MSEPDLIEAIARRMAKHYPSGWQLFVGTVLAVLAAINDAGYVVVKKDEAQP